MQIKRLVLLFIIMLFMPVIPASAQMPNFFGQPPAPEPVSRAAQPTTQSTVQPTASQSATPVPRQESANSGTMLYDPMMDNHLAAPLAAENTGLFGLSIGEVENILRANGAKNYSYAFGKYSRMILAAYVVTIYFSRDKKVGGFSVEPKPPYQTIEPEARRFFMDLFLKDADLSLFEANIGASRLEFIYKP